MRSQLALLIACTFSFGISGCAKATDSPIDQRVAENSVQAGPASPTQNFKSHFADAQQYWELLERGMKLRDEKRYDEALEALKTALNKHAAMRNEQATASDQVAITLESMGNYQEAAKYYDLASELTMNGDRQKSLKAKADVLRQRLTDQVSQ